MAEKAKRKVNPHRRTLFSLLAGSVIVVALFTVLISVLSSGGTELVYLVYEGNSDEWPPRTSNIWIADISNPEEARQLTFYEEGLISDVQVMANSHKVIYEHLDELWMLDTQTGEYEIITSCAGCDFRRLHPNENVIPYTVYEEQNDRFAIYLYHLETEETTLFAEYENRDNAYPNIYWVVDASRSLLALSQTVPDDTNNREIHFYDLETHELVQQQIIETEYAYFSLAPDGTHYITWASVSDIADAAFPNSLPRVLNIHELASGESTLLYPLNLSSEGFGFESLLLAGWHPDSHSFVALETWQADDSNLLRYDYNLYDVETGDYRTLVTVSSVYDPGDATFNHDGSLLVINAYVTPESLSPQLVIYDLNSNQETILPLSGHNPLWVNSGR